MNSTLPSTPLHARHARNSGWVPGSGKARRPVRIPTQVIGRRLDNNKTDEQNRELQQAKERSNETNPSHLRLGLSQPCLVPVCVLSIYYTLLSKFLVLILLIEWIGLDLAESVHQSAGM